MMRVTRARQALLGSIAFLAFALPAALGAAEDRPPFCKQAKERIGSGPLLREAVEVVFGRVDRLRYEGDSNCLDPVSVLHYGWGEALIANLTEGFCHACGGRFSAYVLRRHQGRLRLVRTYPDFVSGGSLGSPGELTPTRFAGDDALVLTSVDSGRGQSEESLSLFVFRGSRLIDLTGMRSVPLSASNGGAVGESEVIAMEGRWIVEPARNDKLIIDYRVTRRGAVRSERAVWGLHGGRLRLEQGHEPPEFHEAAGR
jgi:hypothetical protein